MSFVMPLKDVEKIKSLPKKFANLKMSANNFILISVCVLQQKNYSIASSQQTYITEAFDRLKSQQYTFPKFTSSLLLIHVHRPRFHALQTSQL